MMYIWESISNIAFWNEVLTNSWKLLAFFLVLGGGSLLGWVFLTFGVGDSLDDIEDVASKLGVNLSDNVVWKALKSLIQTAEESYEDGTAKKTFVMEAIEKIYSDNSEEYVAEDWSGEVDDMVAWMYPNTEEVAETAAAGTMLITDVMTLTKWDINAINARAKQQGLNKTFAVK